MATVKAPRRGGRKKNKWTLVSLKQLLGYIAVNEIPQKAFAAHLGVTNSTFHNWKNGRCAPDELVQGKIKDLIDGKDQINMAKKKTGARAPRGSGSSTLAALTGGGSKTTKKVAKKAGKKKKKKVKKVKKVAKKKKVTKVKKKRGRVTTRKPAPVASNGNGNGLGDWNELEALGQFVKANVTKSPTEIGELIGTLKTAAQILG